MSSEQVMMSKLNCDGKGCGAVYEHIGRPSSHLRELAAKDGWRHRKQPYANSNWNRALDLCPSCPDDKELAPPPAGRRR